MATIGVVATREVRVIEACCRPVVEAALSAEEADRLAAAFKVLADPVRLRLLSLVATADGGEVCACDLPDVLQRSQPTVSHHLAVLADAGLITREQRGKWAWFRAVPERLDSLAAALRSPAVAQPA